LGGYTPIQEEEIRAQEELEFERMREEMKRDLRGLFDEEEVARLVDF
jgi:hypothetical protein